MNDDRKCLTARKEDGRNQTQRMYFCSLNAEQTATIQELSEEQSQSLAMQSPLKLTKSPNKLEAEDKRDYGRLYTMPDQIFTRDTEPDTMKTSYDSGPACLSANYQDRTNSLQFINFNDIHDQRNSLIEIEQLSP